MTDSSRTLGRYEIIAPLGAGGMGQVFRARDHRLERDVALKILNQVNADQRIAREARAASALNHPNILAVFDVGIDGETPYIVSELIEGESLREELDRGPLPIQRLLKLATQIADAMSAAHAAGLVHGDLKPENVMIARDGRVKVIDFGLTRSVTSLSEHVPRSATDTTPGLLAGTVPYASPEQARGADSDYRSDQFAFGVMLFEMSAGRLPFARASAVETLAAIINDQPADLATLNPQTPAPVRWIIDRCLAKDPAQRYQATEDLAAEVRSLGDRIATLAAPTAAPTPASTNRIPAGTILLSALALTGTGTLLWILSQPPAAIDLARYRLTPLATAAAFEGKPSWSPDGTSIAYSAQVDGTLQIFRRSLSSSIPDQVTRCPNDCDDPFWSPDGAHIYYHALYRDHEALFRVAASGGSHPAPLIENARHGDISADGRTLGFLREVGPGRFALWFAAPDGGNQRRGLAAPFGTALFSNGLLRYSPDGRRLLIWFQSGIGSRSAAATGFYDMTPGNDRVRRVLSSLAGETTPQVFDWLPDNRHILTMRSFEGSAESHLWIADVDGDVSWPVTSSNTSEGFPSVSRLGQVAFTDETTNFDLVEVFRRASPPAAVLATSRNEYDPAATRDGRRLAYITDRTGGTEIWQRSTDGEWESPLVTQSSFASSKTLALGSLSFNPDGNRLAFQRFGSEGYRLWIVGRGGGTPVRAIPGDENYQDAPTWSPDGEWIAFVTGREGRWSLAKANPGGEMRIVSDGDTIPLSRPQWSPDGRWIAFLNSSGLSLVSASGGSTRTLSRDEWEVFSWNPEDGRLYGLRLGDDPHRLALSAIDPVTGEETEINPDLIHIPLANQPIRGFSWTRQGFMTSIARAQSDVWLLDGLQVRSRLSRWFFRRP